jgi:UDP-N-acetylglucosamine:LPS N-acetylglucosamine transferase
LHLTGKQKSLNVKHKNYLSYEFIEDMDEFYEKVQLVIGRSGGGSLEPAYLGIPQILIPYKHGTTSSHQYLNAKFLEDNNFANIVNNFDELEKLLKNVNDIDLRDETKRIKIPNGKHIIGEIVYEEFFK